MVIDQEVLDTITLAVVWVGMLLAFCIVAEIAAKIFKWGDYDN